MIREQLLLSMYIIKGVISNNLFIHYCTANFITIKLYSSNRNQEIEGSIHI